MISKRRISRAYYLGMFLILTNAFCAHAEERALPRSLEGPHLISVVPTPPLAPEPNPPEPPEIPHPRPRLPECPPGQSVACSSGVLSQLGLGSPHCSCSNTPQNECRYFTVSIRWDKGFQEGVDIFSWRGSSSFNPKHFSCVHRIAEAVQSNKKTSNFEMSDDYFATYFEDYKNFYRFEEQLSLRKEIELLRAAHCENGCKGSPGNNPHFQRITELWNEIYRIQRQAPTISAQNVGFDRDCNLVSVEDSSQICGTLHGDYIPSPISLLWGKGADINDSITITGFKLNPYTTEEYYIWKASAETPLLVYDPDHSGNITSAAQLFGHWTFGGKKFSGLRSNISDAFIGTRYAWENGFEALETLDANFDEKISGDELRPLALWFDRNTDGVSQPGEVIRVSDTQIDSLFYKGEFSKGTGGDITLLRGFQKRTSEGVEFGRSVDWFGEGYRSILEALSARHGGSNP